MASDYHFVHGCMVRRGGGALSRQEELIRRWRAAGGSVRDLERISGDMEPDARTTPQAMRKLGHAVGQQHRHSDLFDDPIGGVSEDWEVR